MGNNSTINIRIDAVLKERGDEVLKQNGVSTTEAIRLLWEELAQTHELPKFIRARQEEKLNAETQRKIAALKRLTGLARPSADSEEDLPEYKELRDRMYADMYDEYLELS